MEIYDPLQLQNWEFGQTQHYEFSSACRSSDTVMSRSNVLLLACISTDYNTTYDSDFQKTTGNNVILQEVGRSKCQPY